MMDSLFPCETDFYLQATFKDENDAEAAIPRLMALLVEGEAANDYLVNSRQFEVKPVSPPVFWDKFRNQFPLVVGYLKEMADTPDWLVDLSAHLDCLVDPRRNRQDGTRWARITRLYHLLRLQITMVWDGCDLKLLRRYCETDLGAIAVNSLSKDDLNPWDWL